MAQKGEGRSEKDSATGRGDGLDMQGSTKNQKSDEPIEVSVGQDQSDLAKETQQSDRSVASAQSTDEQIDSQPSDDRSSRVNAAKAFYRAIYAGDDVAPDDFGMRTGDQPDGRFPSCPHCDSVSNQLAETETKASEVENLYKRMAADFDNYRKRTDREREELTGLGAQRAIEAILPALDDLDRAQSTFTPESEARKILESLKLIYGRFSRSLEQLGVKPMEVVGQPFDPKFHEPVQQIETSDFPDGAVMHDLRRGYLMKEKVIRPSLVNVATNSGVPSGHQVNTKQVNDGENTTYNVQEGEKSRTPINKNDVAGATAEFPSLNSETSKGGKTLSEQESGMQMDVDDSDVPLPRRIKNDNFDRAPQKVEGENPNSNEKFEKSTDDSAKLADAALTDNQALDE